MNNVRGIVLVMAVLSILLRGGLEKLDRAISDKAALN